MASSGRPARTAGTAAPPLRCSQGARCRQSSSCSSCSPPRSACEAVSLQPVNGTLPCPRLHAWYQPSSGQCEPPMYRNGVARSAEGSLRHADRHASLMLATLEAARRPAASGKQVSPDVLDPALLAASGGTGRAAATASRGPSAPAHRLCLFVSRIRLLWSGLWCGVSGTCAGHGLPRRLATSVKSVLYLQILQSECQQIQTIKGQATRYSWPP